MSFVGDLFDGDKGSGFQAQGPTGQQVERSIGIGNDSLDQQRKFVDALNTQTPQAIAAQKMLSGQLIDQTQGHGPNVALNQLHQTTADNVAQQAALMASVRGANANPALIARNAALQGAATQQQAAGQAATLAAQQQIAAQQALGALSGNQIGQAGSAYGQQTGNALTNQGQFLNAQQGQQSTNSGVANTNAKGQQNIVGGIFNGASSAFGLAKGGMVPRYADGGAVNPLSYAKRFADGFGSQNTAGTVPAPTPVKNMYGDDSDLSKGTSALVGGLGKKLVGTFSGSGVTGDSTGGYGGANLGVDTSMAAPINPMASSADIGAFALPFSGGGRVPVMLSPGEKKIPKAMVPAVAAGKVSAMSAGKTVPGKPKVKGDSLKNDVVPDEMEAGAVVIPNHIMQSKDPAKNAQKFVAAIMAKQSMKRARK